ncbi:ThyX-like thymidylate synthase [Mycobacterium phage Kalnoky]|uniref:ThyX-like thymidylate synthase n=1 Tax=Mycobacterium phage PurpleHaze TaxID=1983577 RepID=A0A220NRW5_9CAUD|nr:thymidylate synthase [Mycobacterium phage Purple Haze]AXC35158.1 ThyX-like thymidylate synthase [Mycobacterium phage Phranny]AXH44099.1 ThyX-like thymidylate synthase [Mycobacterium phage Kalnoky]AXH44507.1 ThyX-like thymidylate synthase [Mycobacterium phage Marius]AXH44678.1 ThyX-like thymidylate synthase [Mycobacterium phage PhishRPhriends]AXH44828.1 ThyX-like thymidylate synthase [Mycobacterium phage Reba]QAY02978.1 ThyX-like thymidylate synthase [Mycobacterium phage Gemma]QBP32347.1 T
MKVQLIASTVLEDPFWAGTGYTDSGTPSSADELAEFAGRNCYRSFNRPNPATRENVDYLKHILDVGHESVLEHASATFYIEASRSVLTELERHRHLSFSVVSQRYVDPTPLGVHWPPVLSKLSELDRAYAEDTLLQAKDEADRAYNALLQIFEANGLPRKQAREAARAVLPNMTNSPMVVTGNHRAWRYVIKARWHEAADAEIRSLAGELLKQLREIAPHTYQDIPDTPYSY